MRISGVGIPQLAQLAHALVTVDATAIPDTCANDFPAAVRCFGLVGTLGAGKTRFCQEIASACGIDPAEVTSPTFTLLKSYRCDDSNELAASPRELHHLDLYRVVDEDELWELGLEELWETPHTWTLIEWADRFAGALPTATIWVRVLASADSAGTRELDFQTTDAGQQKWLHQVALELVKTGFTGTIELD